MNANAIKITESTEIKTMTVSDLLTAQDVGDIATPDIQRPAGVWNAEQCAKLEDTISRGWGIGTISLVEIVKDGKTLRLLVDGLQRKVLPSFTISTREIVPIPQPREMVSSSFAHCSAFHTPAGR